MLASEKEAEKIDVVAVGFWLNKASEIVIMSDKHPLGVRRNKSGTERSRKVPVLRILRTETFVQLYGEPLEPVIWPGFDRSKILDPRAETIRPRHYYRHGNGEVFYVVAIERCVGRFGKPSRRPWAILQLESGDLMTSPLAGLARMGLTRDRT